MSKCFEELKKLMKRRKVRFLVFAYGTPYKEEDLVPYYTHIRHGKEPTREYKLKLHNSITI
jgi:protoheme ferro-lyase